MSTAVVITKKWSVKCTNCGDTGHNKRTCPSPKTEQTIASEEEKSKKRPRPEPSREEMLELVGQFKKNIEDEIERLEDELDRLSGKVVKKDHSLIAEMPDYHLMYSLDPSVIEAQVLAEMGDDSSSSSESESF